MLKHLQIQNFKAWNTLDIKLGAVTGLFGTNSSGKSSILQFLLLLKQTKNATDRSLVLDFGGADQLVNLGSYRDVIHAHDDKDVLSWKLRWNSSSPLEINNPYGKRSEVLASASSIGIGSLVHLQGQSIVSDRLEYQLGDNTFLIEPKRAGSREYQLRADVPAEPGFRFVRNQARAWALPGPLKTYLFPDQAKTYYQNADFLSQFEAQYESMMDSIYYLGPLREYPRREYPWSGASPSDVGRRGERTMEAILAATLRGETRNLGGRTRYRPFQEIIAYWLKDGVQNCRRSACSTERLRWTMSA